MMGGESATRSVCGLSPLTHTQTHTHTGSWEWSLTTAERLCSSSFVVFYLARWVRYIRLIVPAEG